MTSKNSSRTWLPHAFLLAVLAATVIIRIRLLPIPLERDEGEFAYMGQLMLNGLSPFSHAYTMKIPGVSMVYALFMLLFGQSPTGIHLGLLFTNLATVFVIWLIGRRLYGITGAAVAAATYALLSLSPSVLGFHAHATHFVVLFALIGFYLLQNYVDSGRLKLLAASGLAFGLAFIMKQHGLMFALAGGAYLLYASFATRRRGMPAALLLFISGCALPYLAVVLWMYLSGDFPNFWFWTVQYAYQYSVEPSLRDGLESFSGTFTKLLRSNPFIWAAAVMGLFLMWFGERRPGDRFFLLALLVFSLLALCPGLVFRPHYFVMLLPAAALLAGASVQALEIMPATAKLSLALPLIAFGHGLYQERAVFWSLTPLEVCRVTYGNNPFPEAVEVARYLKKNSRPKDRIAILGSEPEILFYADRISATGFIYMYGLMENHPYAEQMQLQTIEEIEKAKPSYLVFTNVRTSWLFRPTSSRTLLSWLPQFLKDNYHPVGFADMLTPTTTRYVWGDQAGEYRPLSNTFLAVFKRN